ncbi:MAG: tetratricopeptide repeat protein [Candidatus Eremiobacteraeota bacterium]|nr:tetratricopeptide repeat protein [Candidatus Eremiobacteraeota bacterium]MCW5869201.1 tetratricopeptide repeat protein [Candidatus Eremiobacteraeota bacterium]
MKRLLLFLLLALSQPALAYYPMHMWQAERKAAEGKWAEAAALYREALKEQPKSAEATYNLALCLYRQGQFDKAEPIFKKALELAPPGSLKGQAAYNMGNTQFRQKKLKEALESYKVALRWNENDDDARYNIQVVLDQLNPPKQPPKNDKKKDKDKQKNDQKKDKKKDPKQDPKKKPDSKPKPDKGSPTPTPPGKSEQKPPPPPKPADRDKEDAERLLQFFQNREKDAQKKRFPARRAAPTGEDDW